MMRSPAGLFDGAIAVRQDRPDPCPKEVSPP
jgi:hypothetical protein